MTTFFHKWGCWFIALVAFGIVFTMLFFAAQEAREAARRISCCPDMVPAALHIYHDIHGTFPPAYTVDENGKPLHSWRVLILPYIGYEELYKQIRLDEPWDSPHNSQFHKLVPNVHGMTCQSREREALDGLAHYQMVIGPDTISDGPNSTKLSDITNPESFLIVETSVGVPWMSPQDLPQSALANGIIFFRPQRDKPVVQGIGSPHWQNGGGAWVSFTKASARFLSKDTPPERLLEYSRIRLPEIENESDDE